MVKSGYNPIAGIIVGDKIFDEPLWDWGFTYTHPKGSKRLIAMYQHIYKKYPEYFGISYEDYIKYIRQNNERIIME